MTCRVLAALLARVPGAASYIHGPVDVGTYVTGSVSQHVADTARPTSLRKGLPQTHLAQIIHYRRTPPPSAKASTSSLRKLPLSCLRHGTPRSTRDADVTHEELDIQYTVGLATEVPVTYYFIGFDNQDGDLNGFLDEANVLLGLDKPPQVLTTSYGFSESSLSFALVDKLCRAYAQLGARGSTILFASGDSGPNCAPDGSDKFQPTFPSDCPFVTSVGGTQGFSPEAAWVGSSGGFSNYYPRPAYQDRAVSAYLAKHGKENAACWNATGRAFPDISAKADNFLIYESIFFAIQGTSASSPTVASIIALLNDRLASAGRPPLGFLNPWLYKEGYKAFTDITTGNSSVQCSDDLPLHEIKAVEGWDPVTGFGTPRFDKLLELLKL